MLTHFRLWDKRKKVEFSFKLENLLRKTAGFQPVEVYKIESAKYFQYGFPEAVSKYLDHKETQDYVIIDNRRVSALMNYLFVVSYEPALFLQQTWIKRNRKVGAKRGMWFFI